MAKLSARKIKPLVEFGREFISSRLIWSRQPATGTCIVGLASRTSLCCDSHTFHDSRTPAKMLVSVMKEVEVRLTVMFFDVFKVHRRWEGVGHRESCKNAALVIYSWYYNRFRVWSLQIRLIITSKLSVCFKGWYTSLYDTLLIILHMLEQGLKKWPEEVSNPASLVNIYVNYG